MKIETLLSPHGRQQQMESFASVERYVNDGSPSLEHRTVSVPYSPTDGESSFILPYRTITPNLASVLEVNPSKEARQFIRDTDGNVLFYIHPDMVEQYGYSGGKDKVFTTSSGRTVCVFEKENPLFVKLHYDGMLGRIIRKMERTEVVQALEVSAELDRQQSADTLPSSFGYMPETIGVLVNIGEKEIGYVIRELTVRSKLKSSDMPILIPWFALFSMDRRNPQDQPLLEQWIHAVGKDSSLAASSNFFKDKFLFPMIESFCYLADRMGLIVDYNAQNFLVQPDGASNPQTIVMRDMQSTWSDTAKRKEKKLPSSFTRSMNIETPDPKDREYVFKQRSLYFDHKFSEYIIWPVIHQFAKSFGADANALIKEAREYLLANFPLIREYFSPYDVSFRLPPGITQKDEGGRSILAIVPKSPFR